MAGGFRALGSLLGVTLVLASYACGEDEQTLAAALSTPAGMALAGKDHNLVFISNTSEDALQVLTVGNDLDSLRFVESKAKYFPLRILAGPLPSALAATPDGRFVLVLNALDEAVRVVDTESLLTVREADGDHVVFSLGGSGVRPADMVADPAGCEEPCVGRFFVSLAAEGQVIAFELREDVTAEIPLTFELVAAYDVGGTPLALAPHPLGDFLYIADGGRQALLELELASSTVDVLEVGGEPGPVAVSQDGAAVLVGRPVHQDVVVVQTSPAGGFAGIDADPAYTPGPQCLNRCEDFACLITHPADLGICTDTGGLHASHHPPYEAVYLGITPGRILTLGAGAGQPPLTVECRSGDSVERRTHTEFAMVAGMGGLTEFVALTSSDGTFAPELVSQGWCRNNALGPLEQAQNPMNLAPLSDLLQPCVSVPEGRRRAACIEVADGAGVVLFPGRTGERDWELRWEGILPELDRRSGGGTVSEDGRLSDVTVRYANTIVAPGDVLEVLTVPQGVPTCLAALGGTSAACALERRITHVDKDTNQLTFDVPLEPTCFVEGASIAYRVRAGDQFLVFRDGRFIARMRPGQRLGPSGDVSRFAQVIFGLQDLNPHGEISACQRYDADGRPQSPLNPLLSRAHSTGFRVQDTFQVVQVGHRFNTRGEIEGTVAQLPTGMVATRPADGEPLVFIAYAGGDTVYGIIPFNTGQLLSRGRTRVIR